MVNIVWDILEIGRSNDKVFSTVCCQLYCWEVDLLDWIIFFDYYLWKPRCNMNQSIPCPARCNSHFSSFDATIPFLYCFLLAYDDINYNSFFHHRRHGIYFTWYASWYRSWNIDRTSAACSVDTPCMWVILTFSHPEISVWMDAGPFLFPQLGRLG